MMLDEEADMVVLMVDRHLRRGAERYSERDRIRKVAEKAGARVKAVHWEEQGGIDDQGLKTDLEELVRQGCSPRLVLIHDTDRSGSPARFAECCSDKGAALVLYGGLVSDELCQQGRSVWARQSLGSLERNLPRFIEALSKEGHPRWEFLLHGGGESEAAQQLLTAAWAVQLDWEATGRFPTAKKRPRAGRPREGEQGEKAAASLEKIARAYLLGCLGCAEAESISSDPLARTLKEPTALAALDDLKRARDAGKDWNEWNRMLAQFSRSWLGED
jgi:hypothetical protein